MNIARAASALHKWLALLVGVQILFWVASGAFFAVFPIEQVRSEHRIAERHESAPDPSILRAPADVVALLPEAPMRLTYENDAAGRPVALAEFHEGRPVLIDLTDWRVAS
ncbi:MAG TPA: hypothetical protein PLS69_06335, partial [Terricaulis sp.]|nr:hypothetical protein [Terricaulis sp.]